MIEVLKQALEALEDVGVLTDREWQAVHKNKANELRQAIAELESQEPVAYINVEKRILEWAKLIRWETPTIVNLPKIPLYTHPPQRTEPQIKTTDPFESAKVEDYNRGWNDCLFASGIVKQSQHTWQGLTDEEVNNAIKEKNITPLFTYRMIARTIESKLKELNG
jgi:hypothetical protein